MRFTDSHCHLALPAGAESRTGAPASDLLARAREAGVAGFLVPATNLTDAGGSIAAAEASDDVWAAVGFHPHDAKLCDESAFGEIERLARHPRVKAIGEVGLDYHYMHSPRETQCGVFERHIALARSLDLPVIVHNRESTDDMLSILEKSDVRGILHSFTESLDVARRLIDRGFFISFSGIVTFRTAESLREVARALPHDCVLIETDTPYLAPVPHRGRENEPAFVVRVAELLADLWKAPLDEVARVTTSNFERAFSVTLPR